MKTIDEAERQTPVVGEYDVVVCGGGPAGFAAAVAAARRGARTLLIERYGFLGGTGTAAMMVEFGSIHDGRQVTIGGITHEFLHRMEDTGGAPMRGDSHSVVFDPETMIAVCLQMVAESGADILLHTFVVDAICEGGSVNGVILENKSGREAVLGKVIIDATGDGDVAARAGADFCLGREPDGKMQPVTLEILLGNVDSTRFTHQDSLELVDRIKEAKAAGTWNIPTDALFSMGRVVKRGAPDKPHEAFYFINGTNVLDVNGTDARDLTRAELVSRGQIEELVAFLRKYAPGFENCYLDRTAAQVGIRETRRIVGDYTLSGQEVLAATHFPDGLVPSHQTIDVHDVEGKVFEHAYLKRGTHYNIPYGCFLPKGIEGILVSGRCISTDHHALGSVRRMVTCMPMGDACGIAAALAAEKGCLPRKVPADDIRELLRAGGTILE